MSERFLTESMTADQISAAQNEHYMLDDNIRRMSGKLTAEQKRKVMDLIQSFAQKEG